MSSIEGAQHLRRSNLVHGILLQPIEGSHAGVPASHLRDNLLRRLKSWWGLEEEVRSAAWSVTFSYKEEQGRLLIGARWAGGRALQSAMAKPRDGQLAFINNTHWNIKMRLTHCGHVHHGVAMRSMLWPRTSCCGHVNHVEPQGHVVAQLRD